MPRSLLGFAYLSIRLADGAYNQTTAIEYAKLAAAAYCQDTSLQSWTCAPCKAADTKVEHVQVCHTGWDETQAYIGRWNGDCIVGFEGTETYKSMWTDLKIYMDEPGHEWPHCENCKVHSGYYATWEELRGCVIDSLNALGCTNNSASKDFAKVRVSGHSMGAAVASIAMWDLEHAGWSITESYNFGMPRTGNHEFASTFTDKFKGRFWRVTHHKDIIVQVPPTAWNYTWSYEHTGLEAFYDADSFDLSNKTTQIYELCEKGEDVACSKRYSDVLLDDWGMFDHLHYLGVTLGQEGCEFNEDPSRPQALPQSLPPVVV